MIQNHIPNCFTLFWCWFIVLACYMNPPLFFIQCYFVWVTLRCIILCSWCTLITDKGQPIWEKTNQLWENAIICLSLCLSISLSLSLSLSRHLPLPPLLLVTPKWHFHWEQTWPVSKMVLKHGAKKKKSHTEGLIVWTGRHSSLWQSLAPISRHGEWKQIGLAVAVNMDGQNDQ